MKILVDSREKPRAITKILKQFDDEKIKYYSTKIIVGDYMNLDNPYLVIDRKQNLSEVYGNLCQQHKRFTAELQRAQELGIKLIILIEHGCGINTLEDVKGWYNPRLKVSPYAWDGLRLFKVMYTTAKKYNTEFVFCNKLQTGKRIIELLGGGNDG